MSGKQNPQRKYDLANELISKSYKLNKTLVAEFAIACKRENVTQAGQLSKLMKNFINQSINNSLPQ